MRRCGKCGSQDIQKQNVKGRFFPYENYQVELAFDFCVRTCQACGNITPSAGDVIDLTHLLKDSIVSNTKRAIASLCEKGLRQKQIAKLIGQTPQYVSYLKSGRKIPSFTTYSLLLSYSMHPEIINEVSGFNFNVTVGAQGFEILFGEQHFSLNIPRRVSQRQYIHPVSHEEEKEVWVVQSESVGLEGFGRSQLKYNYKRSTSG